MVLPLLKKHQKMIFLILFITATYFFTRLIAIDKVPIFTDEAIYIRWAQIAQQDSTQRFISLTDGKQPLFIWLMFPLLKIIQDPLIAGRMVSVFAGFGSIIGLFFLGRELFKNKWVGVTGSFLYILYPMVLVHDRLAIYDSTVGMFFIWSMYFTILLVRNARLDIALVLSMITGAGMLTKSANLISLTQLPFSLLLFKWQGKKDTRLYKWVVLALLSAALSYIYYSILRLSPFFYIIAQKNTTFVFPLNEWLQHPFEFAFGNLHGLINWQIEYLTFPVVVLIAASFFTGKKYFREKVFLFITFILPLTYAVFFGKVLYPRYLLFMSLPLLILASVSIVSIYEKLKNKSLAILVISTLLLHAVIIDVLVLRDLATAPIPTSDKEQYINSWSAGGGVKEAVEFFTEQAKNKKIYIGTEGTFGLMPYALEIYLVDNPNITIKGYWPIENTIPQDALDAKKRGLSYFLFYQTCMSCNLIDKAPIVWNVKPVLQVKKGVGNQSLTVYQL